MGLAMIPLTIDVAVFDGLASRACSELTVGLAARGATQHVLGRHCSAQIVPRKQRHPNTNK